MTDKPKDPLLPDTDGPDCKLCSNFREVMTVRRHFFAASTPDARLSKPMPPRLALELAKNAPVTIGMLLEIAPCPDCSAPKPN